MSKAFETPPGKRVYQKRRKKKRPIQQTKLVVDKAGIIAAPVADSIVIEYKDEEFSCPYCLYMDKLSYFLMKKKSGEYSDKQVRCPDCGGVMHMATLTEAKTIEEFAEWMFMTMPWQRVSFKKFTDRLKERGISFQFWQAYKAVKKRETEEGSYEAEADRYEREYREWEAKQKAKAKSLEERYKEREELFK